MGGSSQHNHWPRQLHTSKAWGRGGEARWNWWFAARAFSLTWAKINCEPQVVARVSTEFAAISAEQQALLGQVQDVALLTFASGNEARRCVHTPLSACVVG